MGGANRLGRFLALTVPLIGAAFELGCSVPIGPATEWRNVGWTPEKMSISCAQEDKCPGHQGILFAQWPESHGKITIARCTASAYDQDHVLTAGHCKMEGAEAAYFLPVSKPGRPSRLVRAAYLTGVKTQDLDYASFKLNEPLPAGPFVRPAESVPAQPAKMLALVVNQRDAKTESYVIDTLSCTHAANKVSQVTIDKNPKTFTVQGCTIIEGNSGGVIVSPDDLNSVYGVVSRGPINEVSEAELEKRRQNFGLTDWTWATNARCFGLPGWPQLLQNCA